MKNKILLLMMFIPLKWGFSSECPDSNLEWMVDLEQREKAISDRQVGLEEKEKELEAKKKLIHSEIGRIAEMREAIEKDLKAARGLQSERLEKLVQTVSLMKPKGAAKVLSSMDEKEAALILKKVENSKLALILNNMDPARSAKLSKAFLKGVN